MSNCLKCPPGSECTNGKAIGCSPGKYLASATNTCLPCTANFYCPGNSDFPLTCPLGKIPNATQDDCDYCLEGSYCPVSDSGTTSIECPEGYYCPKGSHEPIPCPSGTYNSNKNTSSETACQACNSGSCCHGMAQTTSETCPQGYFCPADEKGISNCRKYPCPAGTYGAAAGLTSESRCTDCPEGRWCPEGSTAPLDCPHGFFCSTKERFENLEKRF